MKIVGRDHDDIFLNTEYFNGYSAFDGSADTQLTECIASKSVDFTGFRERNCMSLSTARIWNRLKANIIKLDLISQGC